jgi:hypothetical protein
MALDDVAVPEPVARRLAAGDVTLGEGVLIGPEDFFSRLWHATWDNGMRRFTETLVRRHDQSLLRARMLLTDEPDTPFCPSDRRFASQIEVHDERAGVAKWRELLGMVEGTVRPDAVHRVVVGSSDHNVILTHLVRSGIVNIGVPGGGGASS